MNDVDQTLDERGRSYGRFVDLADAAQKLKHVLAMHVMNHGNNQLETDHWEALHMICHKMARIVNGDPNHIDSWVDIAGYAKLIADRIAGQPR